MFFAISQGLRTVADIRGPDTGRPVILAHGGGQTRHAWRGSAQILAHRGYRTITLDLRGHGDSDWPSDGDYRIERFAEDLLEVAEVLTEPPILVGASLGGMAGLLAQGEYVRAGRRGFSGLVLVDITPRLDMGGLERIRGFMSSNLETGFATLEEAADTIASYIPDRPRPKNLSGLAKNLRKREEDGRYFWHWDPRFITGAMQPRGSLDPSRMEEAANAIDIPTLLIRGGKSDLVTAEAVRQFKEFVPHSEFVDVADAGHMVAGDQNDVFTQSVLDFLERLPARTSCVETDPLSISSDRMKTL